MKSEVETAADAIMGHCYDGAQALRIARTVLAVAAQYQDEQTPEPNNETLRKLGAFDRKCRIGKHQAPNWAHLRQTIDTLDAAGQSDAADTLIWTVWHEVNGVARAREFHRIALREREEARAEVARLTALLPAAPSP